MNKDFLAAELVDGGQIRCTWPDDPILAQRLFLELEYQFKLAMLNQAAAVRALATDAAEKRVALADPLALNGLAQKHRGS